MFTNLIKVTIFRLTNHLLQKSHRKSKRNDRKLKVGQKIKKLSRRVSAYTVVVLKTFRKLSGEGFKSGV